MGMLPRLFLDCDPDNRSAASSCLLEESRLEAGGWPILSRGCESVWFSSDGWKARSHLEPVSVGTGRGCGDRIRPPNYKPRELTASGTPALYSESVGSFPVGWYPAENVTRAILVSSTGPPLPSDYSMRRLDVVGTFGQS